MTPGTRSEASLRTRVGATWASYLSTLTAASSYLADHYHEAAGALDPSEVTPQSRLPVPVYSVRELFSFELAKASASISPRPVLAAGLDANYPAPGLPLTFLRLAPSPIEQRFRLGSLGRGWTHNYDYSLRVDADGSLTVREPWGQERVFLPAGNGAFSAAAAGEHATLTRAGQDYLLKERNGFALSFASNRLAYSGGHERQPAYHELYQQCPHLDHPLERRSPHDPLQLTRQDRQRLRSSGSHHLLYLRRDRRASSRSPSAGRLTTIYTYNPADGSPVAHALSAITFPGGTHRYFGWDSLGRLTGEWRDGESERLTYTYDTEGTITPKMRQPPLRVARSWSRS